MKKSFLFIIVAMAGIAAGAAEMTKEQFVAVKKAESEKEGRKFNEKICLANFAKKDLDQNGVLSDEEQKPQPKAQPKKDVK